MPRKGKVMSNRLKAGDDGAAETLLDVLEQLSSFDFKKLRLSGQLTQEKAARIADVSNRAWICWEHHDTRPQSWEPVAKVCRHIVEEKKKAARAAA